MVKEQTRLQNAFHVGCVILTGAKPDTSGPHVSPKPGIPSATLHQILAVCMLASTQVLQEASTYFTDLLMLRETPEMPQSLRISKSVPSS